MQIAPRVVSPQFPPVTSLQAIGQNHPDFPARISTGFSSLPAWSMFSKYGSMLALVTNMGTKTAHAYTTMWQSVDENGEFSYLHHSYVKRHAMQPGTLRDIHPNESRLVSPLFNLSASEFGDPQSLSQFIPDGFPGIVGDLKKMCVDAVIHDDNTSEGDDLFHLRHRFVSTRHAEHDAGVWLGTLLRDNPSITQAQVDAQLDMRAIEKIAYRSSSKHNPDGVAFGQSLYERSLAQEAQIQRGTLHLYGLDRLQQDSNLRMSYPRDVFSIAN